MAEASAADRPDTAAPFASTGALRDAHTQLRQAAAGTGTVLPGGERERQISEIRQFVARARATGAGIANRDERRTVQGILDYWSTVLASAPGARAEDFIPALLAPLQQDAAVQAAAAGEPTRTEPPAPKAEDHTRELIRMTAAARLWRDSGRQYGYLLLDDVAIAQAARFRDLDPDLSDLVTESEKASRRRKIIRRSLVGLLIVALATVATATTVLWIRAENARQEAEDKANFAMGLVTQLRQAQDRSRANAEAADQANRRFDEAVGVLRPLAERGAIDQSALPRDLAIQVDRPPQAAPEVRSAPPDGQANGYNADFLGTPLPLPGLAGGRVRADYIHYSVVLDTRRRLSVVAASNFDRDKRLVLPREPIGIGLDPNLAADIQADPAWFARTDIDYGHLATRQEISWGADLIGDGPELARKLTGAVNVLTNVAPQFDTFNRSVWSGLEQWMLAWHNKAASRVTFFTGPVLGAEDPTIDGGRMPRRFWKIAVSQRSSGARELVVDAFLIAQFKPGTEDKIARGTFDPSTYRVSVQQIESLTGLDFGPALRNAPTSDGIDTPPSAEGRRPNANVYFRFAGMAREDAVALSGKLKAMGWRIPGEERTAAAANRNEIRYGATSDRETADQLATDLRQLGVSRATVARNPAIKPGTVEIWVSR